MSANRIEYIDRLKGFAIILVVMGHLLKTGEDGIIRSIIYAFHMPLFMFLSGIVSQPPSYQKMIKKGLSLLLPFITIGELYSVCCTNHGFIGFFYISKKLGFWYLLVLFYFYLLLPLYKRKRKPTLWKDISLDVFIAITVYLFFKFLLLICPTSIIHIFSVDICYQNWPFFIMGYLFKKYNIPQLFVKYNLIYSLCLLSFIPLIIIFIKTNHFYVIEAIVSSLFFYSIFLFRRENKTYIEKQLAYFGRNTLDIYIYHFFFGHLILWGKMNIWLEDNHYYLVEILLTLIISCLIAYLTIFVGKLIRQSNLLDKFIYGNFNFENIHF